MDFRNVDVTVLPWFIADAQVVLLDTEHEINTQQSAKASILADFDADGN